MIEDLQIMIKKAQTGDSRAVALLVEEHQGAVHGFLTNLLGDTETAKDVTQDTFVKAFRGIGSYSESGNFKAWIFRIARNAGMDYLRKVGRRGGEHLEYMDETQSSAQTEASVDMREQCAIALRLMQDLPEVEREVMSLRVIQNMKFKEIAEVTDAPLNTVLGRMRNATLKMRQWMKNYQ